MGIQEEPGKMTEEEMMQDEAREEAEGTVIEDGNAEEAEAAEPSEAEEDSAEGTEESEEASGDEEEKPKERKLNWAKRGESKKETEEDKLHAQIAEANDKYARLFAEFDNFRKRSEKEKTARYDMGAKDVIEKILPVLDNFERGFDTVEEGDKEDAFVTGMDLVYKQLHKTLEDLGVKPIEAVGQPFDPELHNAVMHVDDPEVGENIVVEEFQKGYMYKDQVVRYSMVKVAN